MKSMASYCAGESSFAVATSEESAQEAVANVSLACDAERPPSPVLIFIYLLYAAVQDRVVQWFRAGFGF